MIERLGMPERLAIMVVALLNFGPRKIGELFSVPAAGGPQSVKTLARRETPHA
jgi:Sec-independent protein translocase protein TatA